MTSRLLVIAAVVAGMTGCSSTCCRKRAACPTCPPPPPAPILGATPATITPEILYPAAPGAPAPAPPPPPPPPAPNFPAEPPRTSGFVPVPEIPSRIANVPAIRLDQPEFSETSTEHTVLKATSVANAGPPVAVREVVPGRLATGGRPSLDDLDRLSKAGYHRVAFVGSAEALKDAEHRVVASRGMRLALAQSAGATDLRSEPTYVYSGDVARLRDWWVGYFRDVEHLSTDAARIRAGRLFP
jgi:hypothetical protein